MRPNFVEIAWTAAEICWFIDFPSWIFEIWTFLRSERSRGSNYITVPNFVEIAWTDEEILRFVDFSRWRPPPSCILKISNFNGRNVKKAVLHQYAKFRWNRSNRDRGIVIFRFSKMAAAAILDFRNLKFLTVVTVKSSKCITARFRQNRLNGGWDMAFLDFPRWRHLRFSKFRIFNRRSRHEWRTAPLCQISSKLLEPRSRYVSFNIMLVLSLIHIWRCRRSTLCRSRWSPYH